jgi:hypothetical protein
VAKIEDHGYKYIVANGRAMGSFDYYIQQECDRAKSHGVPTTVVSFRDKETADRSHARVPSYADDPTVIKVDEGYWTTVDSVTNPDWRQTLGLEPLPE